MKRWLNWLAWWLGPRAIAAFIKSAHNRRALFDDPRWVAIAKASIRNAAKIQDRTPLQIVADINEQLKDMPKGDRALVVDAMRHWFIT